MIGFVGIAGSGSAVSKETVRRMTECCLLTDQHTASYVSHNNLLLGMACRNNGEFAWHTHRGESQEGYLAGEVYACQTNPAKEIVDAFSQSVTGFRSYLSQKEGIFSGLVVEDSGKSSSENQTTGDAIHLFCDKFGLSHIYLYEGPDFTAWASQASALQSLPGVSFEIDEESVHSFLTQYHMSGLRTWHRDIRLVEPAALITISRNSGRIVNRERYWQIPSGEPTGTFAGTFQDATKEMARLFRTAVADRCTDSPRPGLLLSGGLDSRVVLAAMPEDPTTVGVTFGQPNCSDIVIANQVAQVKQCRHVAHHLDSNNWLDGRMLGIRATDGHLNFLAMHGMRSAMDIAKNQLFDVNMSGFLGDALLGGGYLDDPKWSFAEKTANRGRRYISEGLRLFSPYVGYRCPFMDSRLFDLMFQLPVSWLRESKLYNAMLLNEFPLYFKDIPWERTGITIGANPLMQMAANFWWQQEYRIVRFLPWFKRHSYVDYATWLRCDPGKRFFEDALFGPETHYCSFTSRDEVTSRWKAFQANGNADWVEWFGAVATIELFLREAAAGGRTGLQAR